METFTSAAECILGWISSNIKNCIRQQMTLFIKFCEEGNEDGPYSLSLEDVSTYLVHLHESGCKESTVWPSLSILATFFEIGRNENVNAWKNLVTHHLKQSMGERWHNNKSQGTFIRVMKQSI